MLFLSVYMMVLLKEITVWINILSREECSPQCGWALYKLLRSWKEQKGRGGMNLLSGDFHFLLSEPLIPRLSTWNELCHPLSFFFNLGLLDFTSFIIAWISSYNTSHIINLLLTLLIGRTLNDNPILDCTVLFNSDNVV